MDQYVIAAESRADLGKGANRRLRRTGRVPAVLYGGGKDSMPIAVDARAISKQLENEAFFSHILSVEVGGQKTQVVLKALQRAPTNSAVTHLDFLRVSSEVEITMHVPLHFLNEDTCPGRKAGGVVNHLQTEVEVACLPRDLPEYLEIDMEDMELGDSLPLSAVVVPEGVRVIALAQEQEQDHPVVSVMAPQMLDVEPEEEGDEEAAVEDEAPEES